MFILPIENLLRQPKPNYVDPVRRGPVLWIITPIFLCMAIVCVGARLYSRIFVRRWFGLDDLLIILAVLFSIAVNVCVGLGVTRYGWDRHIWDVPEPWWSPSAKVLYFIRNFWAGASSCVRFSVLVLYYRLVNSTKAPRSFRWTLHAALAFNLSLLVIYIFVGIFPCLPIREFWALPPIEAHCMDEGATELAVALLNTFSEFMLATLPLLAVFKLGVDERQRWHVILLLSLGYTVGLVGCLRTYYIWKLFSGWQDLTWWSYPQWICSDVEIDVALICACAAPVRPLVRRVYRRLRGISYPRPRVARSFLNSKGRSGSQNSGTQLSRDYDAASDWQSAARCAIDIEGIALDGYAYSVTISGPPCQRKARFPRFWTKKHTTELHEDRDVEGSKAGLEISHRTEVTVCSSFYSPPTPEPGSSKLASSHRISDGDHVEMCVTPDTAKAAECSIINEELANYIEDSLAGRQTFLDDNQSVDSLDVLPTLPAPTTQPAPASHMRRLSLSQILSFQRRSQS